MAKYVIGDVHGAYRALVQVLERSNFDFEKDELISLGDIADGWSETSECVDLLLKIKNFIGIRGNHDVWLYDWLKYGKTPLIWTQQGGQATIDSYIRTEKFVTDEHKNFWFNQVDWHIDSENRLFIHGGFDTYYIKNEDYSFEKSASYMVNAGSIAKECHWNRSLFEKVAIAAYKGQELNVLDMFKEIYVGHTSVKKLFNYKNFWNMDTGAGWHGVLTMMNVETKEVFTSDEVSKLYPEEKGRK